MLDHAGRIPSETVLQTDLCLIGAGAAGVTLAREFAGRGTDVVLLESGDREEGGETRSLQTGRVAGRPYFHLATTRTRGLGGTTATWAGECRPLDAEDFEPRDWIEGSGWPFGRSELDPYYVRAREVCQLGRGPFQVDDWSEHGLDAITAPGRPVRTTCFHYSRPEAGGAATHFGRIYENELASARNIRVILSATVVALEPDASRTRVVTARVARPDGATLRVTARAFVLAAGGIENPRLLLLSSGTEGSDAAGLGNDHDLVGRYFMEHLYMNESAVLETPTGRVGPLYGPGAHLDGRAVRGLLQIVPEARRRHRLTNFCASLEPTAPSWGVRVLREVLAPTLRGRPPVAPVRRLAAAWRAMSRRASGNGSASVFAVKNIQEQAPNPASRVVLGSECDRFGCRRVELHWHLLPIDKRTAHRAHDLIAEGLDEPGIRFTSLLGDEDEPWPARLRGARHHIGTTRMHDDPRRGVVDATSRVHGMSNLYVAGSSVFPTSGSANPTFTIVALALRLADRLKKDLA